MSNQNLKADGKNRKKVQIDSKLIHEESALRSPCESVHNDLKEKCTKVNLTYKE